MRHRPLGKTGLSVPEIGFGAWVIGGSGWIAAQEDESVRALHRTWPAPDGGDPAETFPGDHIRASLETSLRTSGLKAFDLLQFHVWSDEWMGRGDWLETVEDLKREGKIRFYGVSVNDYRPENVLGLVRSGHVDAVQVIYNAFHQAPEEQLPPACAQQGVGVIVRVALDEGGLTGRITPGTTFPDGDFRNRFFGGDRKEQVKQHVDAEVGDEGIDDSQFAEVALRYVLSEDAVSAVIAGMLTVRNVELNAAAGDGQGPGRRAAGRRDQAPLGA